MNAKEKHRATMINYWGNPDNEFITRAKMHQEILGISGSAFYRHFKPEELQKIEGEAAEERKKNSARDRVEVYTSLLKEAKGGNVQAMKEFLDRTEGKVVEKVEQSNTYPQGIRLSYKRAHHIDD